MVKMIRDLPGTREDELGAVRPVEGPDSVAVPPPEPLQQRRLFRRGDGLTPSERIARAREEWQARRVKRELTIPTWPRWRSVQWLRHFLLTLFVFPFVRIGYGLEVRGRHNFRNAGRPCLIISNHNMHIDNGLILKAMPGGFRRRTAVVAAASDIFGNPVRGFLAGLLGNAFPFATEGAGVREGLENIVAMLDKGWNILIFPEGELTVVGPMKRFKAGTGRIAVDTGVPILPIRIDVLKRGFYEGKWLPTPRAHVRVNIGQPFCIPPGTRSIDATRLLEEAVRNA